MDGSSAVRKNMAVLLAKDQLALQFPSCLVRRIIDGTPDVLPSVRANRESARKKQEKIEGEKARERKKKTSPNVVGFEQVTSTP